MMFAKHIDHLKATFEVLRLNKLYVKESKYAFAQSHVEYLGHIISNAGVSTNPSKVVAMVEWPKPQNVKGLRGFLGLTGYYRRFVKDYGIISWPLTELLKEGFQWNDRADEAFDKLKKAMSEVPTLGLHDFDKPFVLETDASASGVGAALVQEGKPLTFLSKGISASTSWVKHI